MDVLRKDLKRHESAKKAFEEWTETGSRIDTASERFKYLISELSVSYNVDLATFEAENQGIGEIDWSEFQIRLLEFIHKTKPVNIEKALIRAVDAAEQMVCQDLVSAAVEFAIFGQMKKKLFSRKNESWISEYFKTFSKEVLQVLESFDTEKTGEVTVDALVPLLQTLLKTFNFQVSEKDVFLFKRMIENRYKVKDTDSKLEHFKVSFFQCLGLIEEWAAKESYKYVNVKEQVDKTLTEMRALKKQMMGSDVLGLVLDELISGLAGLGGRVLERSGKRQKNLEDLQLKGLKEIFDFYAKQTKMVGQHPSFSEIGNHQSVLNLSKFTKFCSDFELLSTLKEKYKIQLSQLSNIFFKATKCRREMNFADFLASFDYLADYFYNDQYDSHFNERLSILPPEEKRKRLLFLLKCDNPSLYTQRLKGFGLAFSIEKKGFRLPDYDLSKQYKFKDQTKIKEKIENWKEQKKEVTVPSRSKSVPSHARLKAIQQSLLSRPDRITWDLLNRNLNLISRDELNKLFDADDIKELIKSGIKL